VRVPLDPYASYNASRAARIAASGSSIPEYALRQSLPMTVTFQNANARADSRINRRTNFMGSQGRWPIFGRAAARKGGFCEVYSQPIPCDSLLIHTCHQELT
jgi:hypothetical protein